MYKFVISHVCAFPAGCFPVPYVSASLQPIPPENMRQSTRARILLCFSGFVALASASLRLRPRYRHEAPKNSGVCRWWLSDRGCRAAFIVGIDRLGLVAPPLKASGRSRCENNPPEFRPYCPAMKLRRGRNADNFRAPALSGLGYGSTKPKSRRERVSFLVLTPCASSESVARAVFVSRRSRFARFAGTGAVRFARDLALRSKSKKACLP